MRVDRFSVVHLTTIFPLAAALSCSADGSDAPEVIVRDSAGIRIIENPAPAAAAARPWSGMVEIGQVDGPAELTFGQIASALRLRDGRILATDRQTADIRVFGADGQYLATWGRRGSGPGEYRSAGQLARFRGDSILVVELGARRITVLAGDGAFGRLITPQVSMGRPEGAVPSQSCCQFHGALDDGTLLIATPELIPTGGGGERHGTVTLYAVSPEGVLIDTLGTFTSGRYDPGSEPRRPIQPVHFPPRFVAAGAGDGFVEGNGETMEIRRREADGRLRWIARLDVPTSPVSAADREAFQAWRRAEFERFPEGGEEGWRRFLELRFSAAFPAYSHLLTGAGGRILAVTMHRWWDPDHTPTAHVFSPEGEYLGAHPVPPGLLVHDAGEDWLLGVASDDMGVEYLRVYSMPPLAR